MHVALGVASVDRALFRMHAPVEIKILKHRLAHLGAEGGATCRDAVGVPGVVRSKKEGLLLRIVVLKVERFHEVVHTRRFLKLYLR